MTCLRGRRTESGAAVAAGVLLMGVLLTVTLTCVAVVGLIGSHRQVQAAADLAALAGANALQGGGDPCAEAGSIASANQARLASCRVTGFEVTVEVRVSTRPLMGQRATLVGRAKAGPELTGGLVPR